MFRIIANGVELDTHKDIDVSFDFQLEDVVDISKRKSSFSSTIILPGTDINNKFFKHIKETTIDNQLDAKKRIRCSVKNGVSSIMEGYMELLYINNTHGSEEYEVSITQSNRNIWDDIKDYKLSDLDFTRFDHIRNKENIVKSMDTSIIRDGVEIPFKFGRGYVYPTISYGNHLSNIEHYQYTEDTFPALYVKEIWDTLFREFGYEYNSKFINSEYFSKLIIPFNKAKVELSQSEIDRRSVMVGVNRSSPSFQWQFAGLWHVPASPWLYKGSGWSYDQKIPLLDESSFSGDNQFRDDAGQWNNALSLGYVAEKSGYYNIDVDLMCRIQGRSPNTADIRWAGNDGTLKYTYKLRIIRNNGQTTNYVPVDNVGNNTSWDWIPADDSWRAYHNGVPPIFDKPGEEFPISKSLSNIYLNQGEKVLFYVKLYVSSNKIWNTRNSSQGNQSSARLVIARYVGDSLSKFQVTLSDSTTPPNEQIDMNQVLDENMTLRDFFKSILDTFNMMIIEDPTDSTKLLLEPRLDFFKSRQRVLNWDKERKLDHSDIIKIDPMGDVDVKKYLFTYTKDDDYFNKSYENKYDEIYSQIEIDTGDEFSNKDFKIESKFSPTPISSFLTPARPMPYFLEGDDIDDLKPKRVKPRILFYGGAHETNEYRLVDYTNDPNPVILKKYAYCGMWDSPNEPKWDLGFTSPREVYHSSPSFPTQNLYQLFYKDYINNLIDINNVILEAKFHLTPKDIDDFDFRDIVFLDREYWRIISIEGYNPIRSDLTTKVKLIKIMDFESFIESQLPTIESNNNCPIDVRIVSSSSFRESYYISSLGIITEACCNQLGGKWTNGQCRVVMGSVPGTVRPGVIGTLGPGVGGTKPGTVRPVVPITNQYKPSPNIDNNTVLSANVIYNGEGNYIDRGSTGIVIGNNNTINDQVKNVIVIGDDITPIPNSTGIYIGNIILNEDGSIDRQCGKPYMIDSGQDTVFPFDRIDPIDIIDGTIDSVRNRNGDSKLRPIIDNSECPFEDVKGSSDFTVNNRTPHPNQVITFFDRSSGDPDGWEWNFGDGNTSTLQNPTHSYDTSGDYTVSLHSSEYGDYLEEMIKVDYIHVSDRPIPPVANFTVDNDEPIVGEQIQFTDTSTNVPTSWSWDFGDGTTSTDQNPNKIYTMANKYTVTLTVTNADGSDTKVVVDMINAGNVPVANFTADNLSPSTSDVVTFTNTSTGADTYLWNFGDGTTSTLENPTHTYVIGGTFDVSLEATNLWGSDTETKVGYITSGIAPLSSFTADNLNPGTSDVVTFTNTSIGGDTYLWNFGDGNTSTLENPTHTYAIEGTFDVSLEVTNLWGSDIETKVGYIEVDDTIAPVTDFNVDNDTPIVGSQVQFTDTSTNRPTSWLWDFGDGNTSTLDSPTHTYTTEGSFDVSLTSTNSAGSDTKTVVGMVKVGIAPVSSFTADNLNPETSDVVTFTNTSTGTNLTYLWNFGDGNTSTLKNPTHTYTIEGTFDVSLEVTNLWGVDTETKVGYIEVVDVVIPSFTMKIDLSLPGGTLSTNGFKIPFTTYQTSFPLEIDWGDGNIDTITSYNQAETEHIYSTSGIYDISIIGTLDDRSFQFTTTQYRTKLIEVGGSLDITDGNNMFRDCSNLSQCNIISLDNLTDGFGMFYNNSLTSWTIDLPNLTNGSSMFRYNGLTSWTIPLPNLENGTNMFSDNSLTSWTIELPELVHGSYMFQGNYNMTSWDIELPNLTNGTQMFRYNGLTSWTVGLPNLTIGTYMFSQNTINATDYSNLLIDLEVNNPNDNVIFDGGSSKYNSSSVSARANLVSRGWFITDGGPA